MATGFGINSTFGYGKPPDFGQPVKPPKTKGQKRREQRKRAKARRLVQKGCYTYAAAQDFHAEQRGIKKGDLLHVGPSGIPFGIALGSAKKGDPMEVRMDAPTATDKKGNRMDALWWAKYYAENIDPGKGKEKPPEPQAKPEPGTVSTGGKAGTEREKTSLGYSHKFSRRELDRQSQQKEEMETKAGRRYTIQEFREELKRQGMPELKIRAGGTVLDLGFSKAVPASAQGLPDPIWPKHVGPPIMPKPEDLKEQMKASIEESLKHQLAREEMKVDGLTFKVDLADKIRNLLLYGFHVEDTPRDSGEAATAQAEVLRLRAKVVELMKRQGELAEDLGLMKEIRSAQQAQIRKLLPFRDQAIQLDAQVNQKTLEVEHWKARTKEEQATVSNLRVEAEQYRRWKKELQEKIDELEPLAEVGRRMEAMPRYRGLAKESNGRYAVIAQECWECDSPMQQDTDTCEYSDGPGSGHDPGAWRQLGDHHATPAEALRAAGIGEEVGHG